MTLNFQTIPFMHIGIKLLRRPFHRTESCDIVLMKRLILTCFALSI